MINNTDYKELCTTLKITTITSFHNLIGESRKHWIVRSRDCVAITAKKKGMKEGHLYARILPV